MKYIITVLFCSVFNCTTYNVNEPADLDIQGHRGCRGLMPENTIQGLLHALELGVTTLEMDVVISKDSQVVLSHEPFMSHLICKDSLDQSIPKSEEEAYNIYQMNYQEVHKFDCGSQQHPRFLHQKALPAVKPLLKDVLRAVEIRAKEINREGIRYNIETKSRLQGDNIFHPPPQEFVRFLLQEVIKEGVLDRTTIQSFDVRTLQAAKQQVPEISLALLVENQYGIEENLSRLGFKPQVYSPEYMLFSQESIDILKSQGIKVIPWTVNHTNDMEKLIKWGVDGIITDYPDSLLALINSTK